MDGIDQGLRILELERLLQEATETLDAIRNGEVDAIVVGGGDGKFVYTLENADRPYRVLVEQMKEGAVTLNEAGLVLYANRSFGELVDRDLGSLVGSSIFDHVDDSDAMAAMLSAGQPLTTEMCLVTAGGEQTTVNMSIVEIHVEEGAPRMFCSIVTDLTEMRRAEDALRQIQKMDAVGQLTGGVAHDFNNLLMAISSSLAMLEKRLPPDPQVRRLIENAQQGAQRGAALTQRMLAFARRQDLKPEQVDIATLTRGMTELIERTLGPTWPLDLDLPEGLPRVLADANQLEMAILNLVVNARDATPDGGPIRIAAAQCATGEDEADGFSAGHCLCLRVIDR
jgi:PAS domain S-box-containing protein